jgi:hypothetical protein
VAEGLTGLTKAEKAALVELENKLQVVNDRILGVVHGYAYGFYLYGPGGSGKSYSVLKTLAEKEVDHRLFNSRMTAKGLFCALEKDPNTIHVLEDMERLTNDRDAQGVLRSALWAQPGRERLVTWTTGDEERRFTFTGGIIMVANRPLADLPELRALATRIVVHRLEVTDLEMTAQLHRLALDGFRRLGLGGGRTTFTAEGGIAAQEPDIEPATCREICDYVIAESRRHNFPLDLRLYETSCMDYLQWENGCANCDWRDLVGTRVRQAASHFRHEVSRMSMEERKDRDREIVCEILAETSNGAEQLRLFKERTGKGKNAFYHRKREIDSGEFDLGVLGLT